MKNGRNIALTVIALALLVLSYLFFKKDERLDWRLNFNKDSKDPYGCFVIYNLLEEFFPGKDLFVLEDSIHQHLPLFTDQRASYVFIGQGMYLTDDDLQDLLTFVENGNQAFIASRTIPYDLIQSLYYYEECNGMPWYDYYLIRDTAVMMEYLHPELASESYQFTSRKARRRDYSWKYIGPEYICETAFSPAPMGYLNEEFVNFVRFSYGEGQFYLHTNPIIFTNYLLVEQEARTYVEKAFSHLDPGTIYWDAYSKLPEAMAKRMNNPYDDGGLSEKSPLQYILSQASLTWAWYLLLVLGLLFMIFRAKRRQRIIPVLDPNTNTSLEFLSSMGRLYFLQNNHKKIALLKMKFFENHIRDQYNINRSMDDKLIQKLSQRSGIEESHIKRIVQMYENINRSDYVSENTLIDFHQLVDYFYKNCK